MARPSHSEERDYVSFLCQQHKPALSIWIEQKVLEKLDPETEEMYFVLDRGRRYKLRFDRQIREILAITKQERVD